MTRSVVLAVYKRLLRAAASLEHERAAHFVQVQTCLHFRLQRHVTDAARAERLREWQALAVGSIISGRDVNMALQELEELQVCIYSCMRSACGS